MIRHHVDGVFLTDDATERQLYYPETLHPDFGMWGRWTPTAWFDGVDQQTGLVEYDLDATRVAYRDTITACRAVPSPLAMDVQVVLSAENDSGTAHVHVTATDVISYQDLHLRLAIVEDVASAKISRNQVLRSYLPDTPGISFSISLGDTFSHSEDFAVDTAWVAEHCHLVAFVQDDTTREVVQAAQRPLVGPVPQQVAGLTAALAGEDLLLQWSAVTVDTSGSPLEVDLYHIYRDTQPSFEPGLTPLTSTADTFYLDQSGVVGDTHTHYFYSVTASSGGKQSGFSSATGEVDKSILSGK